jgi:hypothetical protein
LFPEHVDARTLLGWHHQDSAECGGRDNESYKRHSLATVIVDASACDWCAVRADRLVGRVLIRGSRFR